MFNILITREYIFDISYYKVKTQNVQLCVAHVYIVELMFTGISGVRLLISRGAFSSPCLR